ncbi:hypothetical protein GCM10009830_19340 [Glycomyces endophyticus]|uniref:Uncharacterized protein n=1 Tax=Glycomyces endophyticus TaxID=480996 RepID=A0ABN2GLB5_9ACTN
MPKAAAIQPNEWATIHDNFEPFDLHALNRVVLDYAHIELALARRWHRRTAAGRAAAATGFGLRVVGLIAAVGTGFVMLAGGADGEALLPVAWVGAILSCYTVLSMLIPWLLTPYRQWDRTLVGITVMVAVAAAASLASALARDWEAAPNWAVALPFALLLAVTAGALVVHARRRSTEKPPAVDAASLTPEELDLLRRVRRRALVILRSRNIVAYADLEGFAAAPFDTDGT